MDEGGCGSRGGRDSLPQLNHEALQTPNPKPSAVSAVQNPENPMATLYSNHYKNSLRRQFLSLSNIEVALAIPSKYQGIGLGFRSRPETAFLAIYVRELWVESLGTLRQTSTTEVTIIT